MNLKLEKVDLNNISPLVDAFEDLPILARLEYAKNLIFDNGGDKHSPAIPSLVLATEILDGVITVLNSHPGAAKLRTADL